MCVCATAKRRRRQAKFDDRYVRRSRRDKTKSSEKLQAQIEMERRMRAGKGKK